MSDRLDKIRERLDGIDDRLIEALIERFDLIGDVARHKAGGSDRLRDLVREEAILTRLAERARQGGLDGFFVRRLFGEIMDHAIRRQEAFLSTAGAAEAPDDDVRLVAFQGAAGAYGQLAAARHFGALDFETVFKGYESFQAVAEAVETKAADYGVLPIENTTAGSINDVYDLLGRSNLAIVGEEIQRIEHCLVALNEVPMSQIRRIYSHPQALAQCSHFLGSLNDCHVESFANTALAAKKIQDEQDLSQAAIASEDCAGLYGLSVIKRNITNQRDNYTRFVVVAAEPASYDVRVPCKTSLTLATQHRKGALLACLNVLAGQDLNLTKLESRPRPNTPWQSLFYIDFEGNLADERVKQAVQELTGKTSFLKVLGSYPQRQADGQEPAAEPQPAALVPQPPATAGDPAPLPAVLEMLEKKPYKLASRVCRPEDTEIRVRNVVIGGSRPVIIAGPCSVESREQVLACAKVVKEQGGAILRGGCFKPRTSPYSFQGLGYEGLDILLEAGRTYDLPVITEVLHPSDVEKVAEQADILQIGARNMQNFSLLKVVGQVDRPVMLKRGMMASIDEWLSAAEYILSHGNQQVVLCERGIRTFETATRSTLDLSAVPVARERTHLPVVVDPSHASGTWRWIPQLSKAALACGAQGIMIEIHPDPEHARCDGPQALNFDTFTALMKELQPFVAGRPA